VLAARNVNKAKECEMLVLSRKINEEIVIGDNIKVTILKLKGNTVRIGIEAPNDVRVLRAELPRETHEKKNANVTVVFSDTLERRRQQPVREVLETRSSDASAKILPFKPSGNDEALSISYRERLPQMLEHNRLQQIVNELTRKK
jgi:carbon storage regulator CsrA